MAEKTLKTLISLITLSITFLFTFIPTIHLSCAWTVGIDENYPPHEFVENGEVKGFNVDLIKAMAEAVNESVEFKPMPWDSVVKSLNNGSIDMAFMAAYEPRKKLYDFTEPVLNITLAIFVKKDVYGVASLDDLKGHTVVVEKSDIAHEILSGRGVNIITVDNQVQALEMLVRGDAFAYFGNYHTGIYLIQKHGYEDVKVIGERVKIGYRAIAVKKGNTELLNQLNHALKAVKSSGKYDEIYEKWFGRPVTGWVKYVLIIGVLALAASSIFTFSTWYLNRKIKEKTEELRESEKKYRDLWENANDILYIHDIHGNFIEMNKVGREVTGYSQDEIRKLNVRDIIDEKFLPLAIQKMKEKILTKQATEPYELLCHTKDGRKIWVEIRSRPIIENGVVVAVEGVARDITERKKMMEELQKYERFYKNAQDLFFIIGRDGKFINVNPKFPELLGYEVDEIIGHTSKKLIHPEELDLVGEFFNRALKGETVRNEFRAITKDGRIIWFDLVEWPVFKDGEVVEVEGIVREITERKRMEEELIKVNRLLTTINNINKLIVHERDKMRLLQRACEELASLEDYYSVWIGLVDSNDDDVNGDVTRGTVVPVASSQEELGPQEVIDLKKVPPYDCIRVAIERKKVEIRNVSEHEICKLCSMHSIHRVCMVVPMMTDDRIAGVVVIYSRDKKPLDREVELLQTLANDLAFTLRSIEVEEERRMAYEQIERNIEQFAILVDRIRNPLSVIIGYTELKDEIIKKKSYDRLFEIIASNAREIEKIVQELDRGWLESEKIRRFLKRGK
jgi:PAS domain S-box-containing protein